MNKGWHCALLGQRLDSGQHQVIDRACALAAANNKNARRCALFAVIHAGQSRHQLAAHRIADGFDLAGREESSCFVKGHHHNPNQTRQEFDW